LLLAPFRVTGQGAATARRRVLVGAGTRVGQFSWFSLVGDQARVEIGRDCTLSASLSVSARGTVVIGDGTAIGERCLITDHGHDHMTFLEEAMTTGSRPTFGWETSEPRPVVIGSGVHVGVGVVILPGVEIGDGAVIGANSVVTKSVPAYSVAAGIPARVIRTFQPDSAEQVVQP
jgi:lipopolysaccharide O-acetyltransferase